MFAFFKEPHKAGIFTSLLIALFFISLLPSAHAGRFGASTETQANSIIIIKKGNIIRDLRLSHFKKIEALFAERLEDYTGATRSQKVIAEKNLVQAFSAFQYGDPNLTPQYNRWVHRSPKKITPLLARAIHMWRLGWFVRGTKWGNETSIERFEEMKTYFSQADADFRAVLKMNPKLSIAWGYRLNMMNTLSKNMLWQKGGLESLYYRAIAKAPKSIFIPDNYFLRLQPRWGGSNSRIITALDRLKLLRTNEKDVTYLYGFLSYSVGRNYLSQKRYKDALKAFQAAGQFGNTARYYRAESRAYYGLKQYKKALIAISRADKLSVQSAENLSLKARILWKLDRRNMALDTWEEAIELAPYDSDIGHWYGYALRKKGYFKKALFILKRSQYFGIENHEIYALQANIQLYHTTDFDQAAINFSKARLLNPNNINYIFGEGSALVMAKHEEKGVPILRHYAKLCNTSNRKCRSNQINWINKTYCLKASEKSQCGIQSDASTSFTVRFLRWLY